MPTISNALQMYDFASVTPLGILYQNVYYTCSRAIRERWFEIALDNGGWDIRIMYLPADMKLIYVITEFEEVEECRVVVRELFFQSFELETYLQSVQLMKLAKLILKNDN